MLFADPWHGGGPWWGLWLAWMVLFWSALFFLIFRIGRRRGPWGPWRYERSGQSVLAERYARGEISEEEYHQRLSVLDAAANRPRNESTR